MNLLLRAAIVCVVLAFGAWVGIGIYRAGGDVPPPLQNPETKLTTGHAEGRRIDGKPSWSLDYDRLITSADTSVATLDNVRHGELYRRGKPFMQIKAQHVVVNTLSNDFIATGPLELIQNDGTQRRRMTSDAANYSGMLSTLTLLHPANIVTDGAKIKVASATVNFRTGNLTVGRILGIF